MALPTTFPSVMGVNSNGTPDPGTGTGGGGGTTYARTFTGSMTPTGALTLRNRGRIFGRPGVVVMSITLPGTVGIRIRRN